MLYGPYTMEHIPDPEGTGSWAVLDGEESAVAICPTDIHAAAVMAALTLAETHRLAASIRADAQPAPPIVPTGTAC